MQVVPNNNEMTIIKNENNESISSRKTTGWRFDIDSRKLNEAIYKDHFPLPLLIKYLTEN